MRALLDGMPRTCKPVVATAYLTLAAALLDQHDIDGAEAALARAMEITPDNSPVSELAAVVKTVRGDAAGAGRLTRLAQPVATPAENAGEMALLYFHLGWQGNELIMQSMFTPPDTVALH